MRPNDLDEKDGPLESDIDGKDEPGLIPCPHCRTLINEEAEQCPSCRMYISTADVPHRRTPLWIWIAAGLAVIAVLVWII